MVAIPLIAMIFLQPEGVQKIARLMPSPIVIGWAILVAGIAVFLLRLAIYRWSNAAPSDAKTRQAK